MISSRALKDIVSEARPIIERQLDDAEIIAGLRDVVASQGGDWSALKALIKAQIQDERDETGNGKRVKKIIDKADFSTGYADMLGWRNMNEKNFSAEEDFDPITGEFLEDEQPETANETVGGFPVAAAPTNAEETGGYSSKAARIVAENVVDKSVTGGESAATISPETAEGPKVLDGRSQSQGKQAPSDVSRDEAGQNLTGNTNSPIAPASQGEAEAPSVESETSPSILDGEFTRSDANTGGDHVTAQSSAAQNQAVPGLVSTPRTAAHPVLAIRPFCQHPGEEVCGGSGRNHCRACAAAMREEEVA